MNNSPSSFDVVPIVGSDPLYYQIGVSREMRAAVLRGLANGMGIPHGIGGRESYANVGDLPGSVVAGILSVEQLDALGKTLGLLTLGGRDMGADRRLHVAYEEICKVLGWQHDGDGSGTITS